MYFSFIRELKEVALEAKFKEAKEDYDSLFKTKLIDDEIFSTKKK